ncbi:MAG: basic amino acid ABC transporter substrate-binding protein [Desulfobulbaceae bacterium]
MMKKIVTMLVLIAAMASSAWAEKEIVFAVDATWPPMEFIDTDKNIVGYSIEYMKAVGEAAGFKPVFKNVAWDGIFAGLATGKDDAICSSVSITDERKKAMDFSSPYFKVRQALIVAKNSEVKSLDELKGQKVGGQIGTTGYFAIKDVAGVEAKSYDEIGLAMEDLNVGRLAAVVCDDPVAANYALNQYKDTLKIAAIIETGAVEFYGIVVQKGNKETLDLLNKGIAAVIASGKEKELQQKWIGQ